MGSYNCIGFQSCLSISIDDELYESLFSTILSGSVLTWLNDERSDTCRVG